MAKTLKEAIGTLDEAGVLEAVRLSIRALAAKAKELSIQQPVIGRVINSIVLAEYSEPKRVKKPQISRSPKSRKGLAARSYSMNINELYAKYIDGSQLFEDKTNPLAHLSEFSRDTSSARSFSRSKKDAFSLEKRVRPGPGSYEPNANCTKSKCPSHSMVKAIKTGLVFQMPYAPGPGAYKPLRSILSR